MRANRRDLGWFATAVAGGVAFALAWRFLPLADRIDSLVRSVERAGAWGAALYAAIYVLGVVLMVPGSSLTLVAGLLYGPVWGTALVSAASTLGASLAFLIARTIGRGYVRARAGADRRFAAIDRAVAERGAGVVFLLRLSPLVPFNLLNYALGLTGVRGWPYVLATWAGMLPGTVLFTMIGASFGPNGRPGGLGPWYWAAVVAATIAATIYISRLARTALRLNDAETEPSP